jgi:hypothetical protein
MFGLRLIKPNLPRLCAIVLRKLCIRTTPQGQKSGFNNGANALHEVSIIGATFGTVLFCTIFLCKIFDLVTKFVQALSGGKDGCFRRLVFLWMPRLDRQQGQVTGVQPLRDHNFAGTTLDFEIDTRYSVTHYIRKDIECLEQGPSMLSPIGHIIWSFG